MLREKAVSIFCPGLKELRDLRRCIFMSRRSRDFTIEINPFPSYNGRKPVEKGNMCKFPALFPQTCSKIPLKIDMNP
jgi:hypothetical protein